MTGATQLKQIPIPRAIGVSSETWHLIERRAVHFATGYREITQPDDCTFGQLHRHGCGGGLCQTVRRYARYAAYFAHGLRRGRDHLVTSDHSLCHVGQWWQAGGAGID